MTTIAACPGAGNCQIIHGSVDGELANGAAGETQGVHHEAIGGEGDVGSADFDVRGVCESLCRGIEEKGSKQAFDESAAGFATGAVGHFDLRIFEAQSLRESFAVVALCRSGHCADRCYQRLPVFVVVIRCA